MLKLNTVLNAAGFLLMALLSFLCVKIWDDVAETKRATITYKVQMDYVSTHLDAVDKHLEFQDGRISEHDKSLAKHEQEIYSLQRDLNYSPVLHSPKQTP